METAYSEADIDLRVRELTLTAGLPNCPVCSLPVPASPASITRRYGPEPDLLTGYYAYLIPSPHLVTLSCGHRIELAA